MTEPELEIPDLLAYALYDSSEAASQYDLPLQMFLASLALFEAGRPLSSDELFASVRGLLTTPDLTKNAFDTTMAEAVGRGLIDIDASNAFSLSRQRTDELTTAAQRQRDRRKDFHRQVRASVERELGEAVTPHEAKELENSLDRYLQRCFHDQSVELARAFGPDGHGLDSSLKGLQQRNLATLVQELVPSVQKMRRNQYQVGIRGSLLALNRMGRSHLATLYHKTVAFALLHQDPTVQRVKRTLARQRIVYLDTNVIMAWMLEAHEEHSLAKQVRELAKSVECELMVSKFTLEELDLQLRESDQKFKALTHQELMADLDVDDDVIRSFHRRRARVPGLAWPVFLASFRPAEEWLKDHGVKIDRREDWANAVQDDRKQRVVAVLKAHKRRDHAQLIEFDAHNLLYIQLRRRTWRSDAMGSRVWFVTLDRKLTRAEAALVREGVYAVPSSHGAAAWCEFMSPYAVPASPALDDYVNHLVQSQLGILREDPKFVETRFLIKLGESGLDLDEILKAGPQRAGQILVGLQESKEVRRLLQVHEGKRQTNWNSELSKAVGDAIRTIGSEEADDVDLRRAERERDQARRELEAARRSRDGAMRRIRYLADSKGELERRLDRLEERLGERAGVFGRLRAVLGRR